MYFAHVCIAVVFLKKDWHTCAFSSYYVALLSFNGSILTISVYILYVGFDTLHLDPCLTFKMGTFVLLTFSSDDFFYTTACWPFNVQCGICPADGGSELCSVPSTLPSSPSTALQQVVSEQNVRLHSKCIKLCFVMNARICAFMKQLQSQILTQHQRCCTSDLGFCISNVSMATEDESGTFYCTSIFSPPPPFF